ncbi:SIS domain-containing protein [Candidatus Gracilibacteria bacterium]|nr:SIS domain-containing protein [Candidatus Gracilibacteria bacterium]
MKNNLSKRFEYAQTTSEQKEAFINQYIDDLSRTLKTLKTDDIIKTIDIIEEKLLSGKKIFIAGNGGSAATSSHMVSDLQKTTLGKNPQEKNESIKFKAISLNDNMPVITAWANDEGFDYIFSEQLETLGENGDLLIIITGSGNSKNIIMALEKAKQMGIDTVGFLGFQGGKAKELLDHHILVESDKYGPIEDIHGILNHLMTAHFQKQVKEVK